MSEKISGIIEARDVRDVAGRDGTSQKISLKINGKSYSAFANSIPGDVAERLGAVKQGDEVELSYTEKPGTWQGKSVTYRNITDIMKVIRTGETAFSESPAKVGASAQPVGDKPKGDSRSQDGSRDDMMRLSYSKDTIVAILTRGYLAMADGETEELFIARVFSLIKAGAKTLGE